VLVLVLVLVIVLVIVIVIDIPLIRGRGRLGQDFKERAEFRRRREIMSMLNHVNARSWTIMA
jgi:hypothetical protein